MNEDPRDIFRELVTESDRRLTSAFHSIVVLLLAAIMIYIVQQCSSASAEDLTALHLAQCLRAECDSCERFPKEKAAIAGVLQTRAKLTGRTLDEQILAYCAVYKSKSERSRAIWSSTFEAPQHGPPSWWAEMHEWTERFIAGEIPNPHPNAKHFGCAGDAHRMIRAGLCPVAKYSNTFWGDCDD